MILLRKGFNLREKCHRLSNCNHLASASHCIKGTEANAEWGEIIQIRENRNRPATLTSTGRELRDVINSKPFFQLSNLIHDFEEAILAEQVVLLFLEVIAQGVILVGRDDGAEGGG